MAWRVVGAQTTVQSTATARIQGRTAERAGYVVQGQLHLTRPRVGGAGAVPLHLLAIGEAHGRGDEDRSCCAAWSYLIRNSARSSNSNPGLS
jgi:hypothetical protein